MSVIFIKTATKRLRITFNCGECGASGYVEGDEWVELARCPNTRESDKAKHVDPSMLVTTREELPLQARES